MRKAITGLELIVIGAIAAEVVGILTYYDVIHF